MRILLLAPKYMGLYKSILIELEKQGHNVVFIEDDSFKFDYRYQYRHDVIEKIRNVILKKLSVYCIDKKQYWDSILRGIGDLRFDVIFVVNGFSYDNYLLQELRKYNNEIKTRLYLWDNLYVYDFSYVINDFQKCYTLDYLDSTVNEKLCFLPAFWTKEKNKNEKELLYDVFMVGTNHDDRYSITKKVIKQLNHMKSPYFIKIIDRFRFCSDLIIHKYIPSDEYTKLMEQSRCILDTERPSQTGPTVRMIWALALGKKIITTNTFMTRMPFFNPKQIAILDRNHPIVEELFVKSDDTFQPNEYIMELRIDNWVRKILV